MQRSLILAKELFAHSDAHAQQGGELDRMVAIHGFDNAVEVMLRAISRELDLRTKRDHDGVMDLVTAIGGTGRTIPERHEIQALHLARNGVQHDALSPSQTDVQRWRDVTKAFLCRAMQEYFVIDMETLSSATFVEDGTLRSLLQTATALLRPGASRCEMERAFMLGVLAFECPRVAGQNRKRFREVLPLMRSSVTPLELSRYDLLPVGAFHMADGSVKIHWQPQKLTTSDVEWLVPFVVRAILDAQSQVAITVHERAKDVCLEVMGTPVEAECP